MKFLPHPCKPTPETVWSIARIALAMLVCAMFAACSTAPSRFAGPGTFRDRLDEDEKPSMFASYFVLDNAAQRDEIVMYSAGLIGTPYVWAGASPEQGLDCSGLLTYILQQVLGRTMPHYTGSIAEMTRPIKRNELAPGDIVFFNTTGRRHSHMGIYIGDNNFIHAPAPGAKVRIERLGTRYYTEHLDGLRTLMPR
ncbi:MAG: C40 family peptidase [Azoarcus sp.]|jgi:cell wall-associated NlpC family hydrolase|nr:C40 family peptidase [Azoarcus sp.]